MLKKWWKKWKKKKMEKNCYHIYIHYNEGKTKKKNQKEEKPKKRNIIKKNLKTKYWWCFNWKDFIFQNLQTTEKNLIRLVRVNGFVLAVDQ